FGGVIRAAWPMHVRHGVEGPPVEVEPGLALHAGERLLELDQPLGWRAVAHDLGARTDELVVRRGSVAAVAELGLSHAGPRNTLVHGLMNREQFYWIVSLARAGIVGVRSEWREGQRLDHLAVGRNKNVPLIERMSTRQHAEVHGRHRRSRGGWK